MRGRTGNRIFQFLLFVCIIWLIASIVWKIWGSKIDDLTTENDNLAYTLAGVHAISEAIWASTEPHGVSGDSLGIEITIWTAPGIRAPGIMKLKAKDSRGNEYTDVVLTRFYGDQRQCVEAIIGAVKIGGE